MTGNIYVAEQIHKKQLMFFKKKYRSKSWNWKKSNESVRLWTSMQIPGQPGNIFLSYKNRNAINWSENKKFFWKKFTKSD